MDPVQFQDPTLTAEPGAELAILAFLGGFMIVLSIIYFVAYILFAVGLFQMAKKRGVGNAWLAFIPLAQFYILGKLVEPMKIGDFEVPALPVILVVSPVLFSIFIFIPFIGWLLQLALMVLYVMAFYNLYKKYTESALVYTIFSFFGLAPIFVFILRNKEPLAGSATTGNKEGAAKSMPGQYENKENANVEEYVAPEATEEDEEEKTTPSQEDVSDVADDVDDGGDDED